MPRHKSLFLVALVVSISTDVHLFNLYSETNCTSEACKFLFEKLVEKSQTDDACRDFQFKVCKWRNDYAGDYDSHWRDPQIIQFEAEIKQTLAEKMRTYNGRYGSINSEKELFEQCQKLRSPRDTNKEDYEWGTSRRFLDMINLTKGIGSDKWQNLDQRLHDLGFGHAFFDVKVVQDPSDMNRNIILLESPSVASLATTREILSTHYQKLEEWFTNRARNFKDSIDSFFESWVDAANNTVETPYLQFPNKRMTLQEWDDKFNKRYDEQYLVDINWAGILIQIFREVNIEINDDTPIIVKNERTYFEKLYYLLRDTPKDVIAAAILYKTAAENLRYVDWQFFQLLNDTEGQKFCFNNIKLYGLTTSWIYDFLYRHTSENNKHYQKLKDIVNNVTQFIRREVEHSSMSYRNEVYLLGELDNIVAGLSTNFRDSDYSNYVTNYYGYYHVADNYCDSIINYREMLKKKELSTLASNPKTRPKPFSVTDSIPPSNRFLLYILFMANEMSTHSLPEDLPK